MSYAFKYMILASTIYLAICAIICSICFYFQEIALFVLLFVGGFSVVNFVYGLSNKIVNKFLSAPTINNAQENDLCPLCRNVLPTFEVGKTIQDLNAFYKDCCPFCGNKDLSKIEETCKFD